LLRFLDLSGGSHKPSYQTESGGADTHTSWAKQLCYSQTGSKNQQKAQMHGEPVLQGMGDYSQWMESHLHVPQWKCCRISHARRKGTKPKLFWTVFPYLRMLHSWHVLPENCK
jgi:hypothetical protein